MTLCLCTKTIEYDKDVNLTVGSNQKSLSINQFIPKLDALSLYKQKGL
ncbi:hypothetical protein BACI349Y_50345 [Bacillus sp. 349Y]|nr:hypothetical protein BACI349Y_50345 [Bacillus sp. 349Y]